MKTKLMLLTAALGLAAATSGRAQTTIFTETFETDGLGSRYTAPNGNGTDADQDYFDRISNGTSDRSYTNVQGTFYWGGQDTDDSAAGVTGGDPTLLFTGIDITGYTDLTFSGFFAEQRPEASGDDDIDAGDFFLLEYQIDSGGYQDLLAFKNDGSTFNTTFLEDTNFDGIGDGTQLETSFAQFSKSITGTGSSLDLRFTMSVDSGDEDIAFDSLQITAIPEPSSIILMGLVGLAAFGILRGRKK